MTKKTALFALFVVVITAHAAISDDKTVSDGWQWVGIPLEDFAPWSLEIQSKEIEKLSGHFVVVFGYLVATPESVILYATEESSRRDRTQNAVVVLRGDSPAMRWQFPLGHSEGFYAVGGIFTRSEKGTFLGQFTKVRFAMKKEMQPNQAAEPTASSGRSSP